MPRTNLQMARQNKVFGHSASFKNFPTKQKGMALLILVAIVSMGVIYIFVKALNQTTVSLARNKQTFAALAEAKVALIGRAASDDNRPGSLPCPDTDNDGIAELLVGQNCPVYIGRLPWKTLGLSDLRDGNGERLWYALSANFRDASAVQPLNSDTLGQLIVTGATPASNVIAIIFAPGPTIGSQVRDTANENIVGNYLEGENASTPFDNTFTSSGPVDNFNDQLMTITHSELFSVVENAVEKRMESQIKPYLINGGTGYYDTWGAFPFAAAFASPGACNYAGVLNTREGLIPACPTGLNWNAAGATVQKTGGSGAISSYSCSATSDSSGSTLNCTVRYTVRPNILLQATVNGVGMGFAGAKPQIADVNVNPSSWSNQTISVSNVLADGSATLTYTARLRPGAGPKTDTIAIPIAYSALLSPSDPVAGWFIANNWHYLTYYAVSNGYTPGGGNACNPLPGTPSCLTANNMAAPNNDKRALLVLAGRALAGQNRPSAALADYLEGQNATPADFVYEKNQRTAAFNDRIIVVAP